MLRSLYLLATVVSACLALLLADPARATAQRNVVVIVVDDLGFQIGCYGDPVAKTPALDRLATEGTRFRRAFCTTASCSASRSVILTGLHNHANGQYGHEHSYHHFRTKETIASLPVLLGKAGYRTCSIGKFHVAPREVFQFETYANEGIQGARNSVRMAHNARRFIESDDPRPFFLYYCTSDPHRGGPPGDFANNPQYPGVRPVVYDPAAVPVPPWLPDSPGTRRELAEYYQAIARLDQGVGALLTALQETGNWSNTLILFLSDNGPPFPNAKTTLYEPGMNVPLIVRTPEQQKRGIVSDATVTWTDLVPTILDWTRVPHDPKQFHGRSFLSVVEDERPAGWDTAYGSHTFHEVTMYYPMRVIRQGDLKYILNLAHQLPYPFASDLHSSLTWQGVLQRGDGMLGNRPVQQYLHRPRHELYDLSSDPHELRNLADDPAYAQRLSELQRQLKQWQQRTGDPWVVKYEYE